MNDWRSNELTTKFLTGIRGAIPLAEMQLGLIVRLIGEFRPALKNFLDLGCGDGILGRYIQDHYPDAAGVYLDYSEPMIRELKNKLKRESKIITGDYSGEGWLGRVREDQPFDLIVSGFSIHHLEDPDKKKIYRRIFDLLKPGGLFLNLEHVASASPRIEKVHDDIFIEALAGYHKGKKTREEISREYVHREDKILNKLAPVEAQCGWLREIGFSQVDCYFRLFEVALFGGIR